MATQDWEARAANTSTRIQESSTINERNKELIQNYKRDKLLNGMSHATISRNLNRLKILGDHLEDRRFDELEKDDLKDVVEWLYSQDYTDGTIDTYKNVIRSFYRWLDPTENGETPPRAAWIKLNGSNDNQTLPKDLLTKDDVHAQTEAAKNPRDKALIQLLYETGARIGELIDLTVGDIEDRKHGKKVVIEGKTGARRVPLVESVPYLNRWLGSHPNPEKEAPLWCKIRDTGPNGTPDPSASVSEIYGVGVKMQERLEDGGIETCGELRSLSVAEVVSIASVSEDRAEKWIAQCDPSVSVSTDNQLSYRYIRDKVLIKTMEKAGIDKPANPHHYRHSRASFLANEMTEAQLCEWFGWVQGSDVPAKYVHLSGRDLDNAYDNLHGLYEPEDDEQSSDVIECPRCEEINRPEAVFCDRCGFAFDQDAEAEVEEKAETLEEQSDKMVVELESELEEQLWKKMKKEIRESRRDNPEQFLSD